MKKTSTKMKNAGPPFYVGKRLYRSVPTWTLQFSDDIAEWEPCLNMVQ